MQGSFRSSRLITREVSLTLQVIASVSIAAGGIILRVSLISERSMLAPRPNGCETLNFESDKSDNMMI